MTQIRMQAQAKPTRGAVDARGIEISSAALAWTFLIDVLASSLNCIHASASEATGAGQHQHSCRYSLGALSLEAQPSAIIKQASSEHTSNKGALAGRYHAVEERNGRRGNGAPRLRLLSYAMLMLMQFPGAPAPKAAPASRQAEHHVHSSSTGRYPFCCHAMPEQTQSA
jgi:hypothetical protein